MIFLLNFSISWWIFLRFFEVDIPEYKIKIMQPDDRDVSLRITILKHATGKQS